MQVTELTQDLFEAIERAILKAYPPESFYKEDLPKEFALLHDSSIYRSNSELRDKLEYLRICDAWQIITHLQNFTIPTLYKNEPV